MDILFATRKADGVEVVVKTRKRNVSFANQNEEREWRMTMEYQMNMPKVPQICQIEEVFMTSSMYYVVMEKVEGQDLSEIFTKNESFSELQARGIIRQVL